LILVLFRDGQCDSDTLAAILSEVMCGFEDPNPPVQIDVRDQPALAALYLLQSLLDARAPRAQRTAPGPRARHRCDAGDSVGGVRDLRAEDFSGARGLAFE
jgi:hypothetical protein